MKEGWLFLIIFGAALLAAAAALWFSKDPRNSFLLYKVTGIKDKETDEARKIAREIAAAVAGVGLALIVFSVWKML